MANWTMACIHIRNSQTATMHYTRGANPGCELVELRLLFTILPLVLRNMFYRGTTIHHFVRFGSDSSRWHHAHSVYAVPPDRVSVFRSAETGEAERLYENGNETAKFAENHQIFSRLKVRWEILMGFWPLQIIMSILAECQRFARHGLGETWAKPPASGDGLSNNMVASLPKPYTFAMFAHCACVDGGS
jgi:hypothetical protein